MRYCCFLLLTLLCKFSFAQSDTSIVFMAKDGHTTTKDSAYTMMKFYQRNGVWHGKEFFIKNGLVKSDGDYADNSVKTPIGTFNNYTEAGKLYSVASYTNGKANEVTYYYPTGNKKSWVTLNEKGDVNEQKGWDETGKEIKNFIVMREARFKGGPEGWQKYLQKKMNGNVALDAGAPAGEYKVIVSFKVTPDGSTSNVKVESFPAKCKPCAGEAMRVIVESREWEPAIFQNIPVDYYAKQPITFLVQDDKKKKN